MAKRYPAQVNKRRRFGDRKGYMQSHINCKKPLSEKNNKAPCLHDCANCPKNSFCTTLPYI